MDAEKFPDLQLEGKLESKLETRTVVWFHS